jgi:ribonucleoside-diphosphate reductase beta chain
MGAKVTIGELSMEDDRDIIAPQLLKTMAAIYALESTAFMASFACTFALTREQFQGISKHVSSICNDEVLHAEGGRRIVNIMLHKEGYDKYLPTVLPEIKKILDAVVKQEFGWADYVFSEGRKVIGLNAAVLKDYVRYVGVPMYSMFGLLWDEEQFGKLPTHDPLPYMEKYIDRSLIQSANQEIENNSYRIAQTDDDLDDDEIMDF